MKTDKTITGFNVFTVSFVFFFACQACSSALAFSPDIANAFKSSEKILRMLLTPTLINAVDEPVQKPHKIENFKGDIEFKNVWFRYPSRPKQWVLKGFSLKISSNECIAIVGESGQGKSTLVNLLLRFYDVNFGEILIDGVDIRSYDVRELRAQMGLVM